MINWAIFAKQSWASGAFYDLWRQFSAYIAFENFKINTENILSIAHSNYPFHWNGWFSIWIIMFMILAKLNFYLDSLLLHNFITADMLFQLDHAASRTYVMNIIKYFYNLFLFIFILFLYYLTPFILILIINQKFSWFCFFIKYVFQILKWCVIWKMWFDWTSQIRIRLVESNDWFKVFLFFNSFS